MAKRIRYIPTSTEGVLNSLQSYDGYKVSLNLKEKTYVILAPNGSMDIGQVRGGAHKLKMAAKKKLIELGIDFEEEKRKVKGGEDVV